MGGLRTNEEILTALDHAGARPEAGDQNEKRHWSERFAHASAVAIANEVRRCRQLPPAKKVLPLSLEEGTEPLTPLGAGTAIRLVIAWAPISVLILMDSREDNPINIGNPHEMSIEEMATLVIRMTGSASRIVFQPLPTDDPKVRRPDITRARTLLGWELKVPLDEGLTSTIDYFKRKLG